MARPKKKGLDYFPLDTDFFSDEKIVCIAGEYGVKGQVIVISLLCAIYRNGYFIEWSEMMQYRLLRDLPGISPDLLKQVVRSLVRWGFFDQSLFDSAKILTSRGIQSRYFEITKKRVRDPALPYLLPNSDQNLPPNIVSVSETIVSSAETHVSAEFSPQSKVNKMKINKTPPLSPGSERAGEKKNFEEYFEILASNVTWRKAVSASHGISPHEIPDLIRAFRLWIISIGEEETIQTLADAKRRFTYWLKSSASKPTKQNRHPEDFQKHPGQLLNREPEKALSPKIRQEESLRGKAEEDERLDREKVDGYYYHRKFGYPSYIPIWKVTNEEWRKANPPESFQ